MSCNSIVIYHFIAKIYLFFAALQSSQADCLPFISAALIYFPRKVPTHIWQLKFTPFDLLAISLFQIHYHYYQSLSLVWCQQTAGKFKSMIIDLLTTDIFLEKVPEYNTAMNL